MMPPRPMIQIVSPSGRKRRMIIRTVLREVMDTNCREKKNDFFEDKELHRGGKSRG